LVTPSSGNVFTDLGFGPSEAAVMGLHAVLIARLRVLVQTEGWTQAQAAEQFGIAQTHRLIELAQQQAQHTCEECGQPGVLLDVGVPRVRCAACAMESR
jgi:predicted XRE-type DNA-binding protein